MGPLSGRSYEVRGAGPGAAAAERVLVALGGAPAREAELVVDLGPEVDPLAEWARCGGMWLTGEPTGPTLPAPGDQAARLVGLAAVARALASRLGSPTERAGALGLRRRGTTSPNGGTRLLPAADGWVAMTLTRPDDAAVAGGIAALTGEPGGPPLFCADAYADPVAGLCATVAAFAGLLGGGGWLVDLSMRDAVAHLLADAPRVRQVAPAGVSADAPPMPVPTGTAPPLGRTGRVLTELGIAG
jgi:CoA-transferase family III